MAGNNPFQLIDGATALSEIQMQIAQGAQALMLSAGLLTGADALPPAEIDTPEEFIAVQQTAEANRDALRTRAASVDADALSMSEMVMWNAAIGLSDPVTYGGLMDDFLDNGAFHFDQDTFASLLGRISSGQILASDETAPDRPEPAPTTHEQNVAYYMHHHVLDDQNPYVRQAWDMTQSGVAPVDALNQITDAYIAGYEETYGEPLSEREATEFYNTLNTGLQHVQRVHQSLLDVRGTEVTPQNLADAYIEMRFPDEETRPAPSDIAEIRADIIAFEGIQLTTDDAVRLMADAWAGHNVEGFTTEYYLDQIESRSAHYQSAEGGGLDEQTAAARAVVDTIAEMDMHRGVAENVIVDSGHFLYSSQIENTGSWMRRQIIEEQGLEVSNDYLINRDAVGEQALSQSYREALSLMTAEEEARLDTDTPEFESDVALLNGAIHETFAEFQTEWPEEPGPAQMEYMAELQNRMEAGTDAFEDGRHGEAFIAYNAAVDMMREAPEGLGTVPAESLQSFESGISTIIAAHTDHDAPRAPAISVAAAEGLTTDPEDTSGPVQTLGL